VFSRSSEFPWLSSWNDARGKPLLLTYAQNVLCLELKLVELCSDAGCQCPALRRRIACSEGEKWVQGQTLGDLSRRSSQNANPSEICHPSVVVEVGGREEGSSCLGAKRPLHCAEAAKITESTRKHSVSREVRVGVLARK
jgi:hypothetical protein